MFDSRRQKTFVYAALITVVFLNTFFLAIERKMNRVIPASGINRHVESMAIAISDLKYGLKGYGAYYKILLDLQKNGMLEAAGHLPTQENIVTGVEKNFIKANNALKNTLNIKNVSANGTHYMLREYKGLIDFYKISFQLFGYNIQGYCYLYFLIFGLSVVVFFMSFYSRLDLLQFLLLFLCAHFVTVALGLQVVHNQRFMPVLTILPVFHLSLLILGKNINKKNMVIGAAMQIFILIFALHIRGSAKYQLMFLPFLYVVSVVFFYMKNSQLGRNVFYKVRFWPLMLVFIGVFLLKMHLITAMNYPYTDTTSKHLFWHTIYIGMGAHPASESKYGIIFDDNVGFSAVSKLSPGSVGRNYMLDYDLSEKVMKKECLRIMKSDTLFYVQSILYKVPKFLKLLFASKIGFVSYFFMGINIIAILIGVLLCGDIFLKKGTFLVYLTVLQLMFASIPFLVTDPSLKLSSEPILVLTFLLYIILVLLVCFFYKNFTRIKRLNSTLCDNNYQGGCDDIV